MTTLLGKTQETVDLSWAMMQSPVGTVVIGASEVGVKRIVFCTSDHCDCAGGESGATIHSHLVLTQALQQLTEYFAGTRTVFSLPTDVEGTKFQKEAWSALADIPYGQTMSYQEQAHLIGRPKAVRAIGTANSRNPISIVRPCHRVVGSDGSLSGYAWGLEKKKWLLEHERSVHAKSLSSSP
jgi:methylated-DNA-[protein]-cysteine S-methyltransferase